MNPFRNLFSPEFTEALGWTIVHSLWQATAVGLALAVILLLIRRKSAQIKYFISFAALMGILCWSAVTFVQSYRYAAEKQQLKTVIIHNPSYVKALLQPSPGQTVTVADTESSVNLKLVKTRAFFQRNFYWICFVWICGLVLLMTRLVGGYVYTRRLRNYQLIPLDSDWLQRVGAMAAKMGIRRKVVACCSPLTLVPLTIGTFKPVILFPVSAFTGLSADEIEAILAHELAHVVRNDYFFNIIQSLVEILFFYHPAVWIISAQIRSERENSCDNVAIAVTGNKIAYVKALAAVQMGQYQPEPQLSMAFSASNGNVLHRIKRIQKQVTMKTNFSEGVIAAAVIIVGLTLASFSIGTHVLPERGKSQTAPIALTKAKSDSIRTRLETAVENSTVETKEIKELQQLAEMAYSESDTVQSAEILQEIDKAMRQIDVEKIVNDAMKVAHEAMKNASVEIEKAYEKIDKEQLRREIEAARADIEASRNEIDREQLRGEMEAARADIEASRADMERDIREDMQREGASSEDIDAAIKAASAGLDIAASVVSSIDIDGIVSAALAGTTQALEAIGNIDIDSIAETGELDHQEQLKAAMKSLEQQQKQLEIQQKQLKKQMKNLEKQEKQNQQTR